MNRLRVEGLLAAFPKLVGHAKQHTFVETDSVRYVYQPLENHMYLLLITTKTSNIVEDLGTLRLLAKVVPDVAGGLQENAINEHAFELIFAFDEVLSAGGYKEEVTLTTIRANLEMESHEEKMADMIQKSKEEEARANMRQQAARIKEQQMKTLRENFVSGSNGPSKPVGGMEGFGSDSAQRGGGIFDGFDSSGGQQGGYNGGYQSNIPSEPVPEEPRVKVTGMQLGGKKKNVDAMQKMAKEDNLFSFPSDSKATGLGLGGAVAAAAPAAPSTPLTILLEEKINVAMNREGAIDSCEVKGTVTLTANTEQGASANVSVNKSDLASKCKSNWTFNTHPKVNKPAYEKSGVLSLKGGKGLPLNRPVGVLRWSYGADDAAPLTINCWPEDEGNGTINVNIELELTRPDMSLHDVNVLLPLGTTDPPAIEAIDGQYKHDPRAGMLCWHFDVIDANNATGSLEFSIGGSNTEAFFPVQVAFTSQSLLCPIEITEVVSSVNGAPIPNNLTKNVVPESYQCA